MAIRTPFVVIEAALTEFGITTRALLHAATAMLFIAAFAVRHALVAEDAVAAGAVVVTFAAHRRLALFARPPFVVADRAAAVGTFHAVPVGQRNEGAARVVRAQQVGDDQEEIKQAALLQRFADRLMPVALTNRFVLYVRMRDAFVRRGGIGIDGDHAIVVRMAFEQVGPVEANLEGA